jgi:carbonic anhydrase
MKTLMKTLKWDLGIPKLWGEWQKLLTTQFLTADINAGITVACIAIPLSLAIALASGVDPAVGLITAIVAGIVCAIFGGTPMAVSGPAAAMTILIASNIETFGVTGLVFMCLLAGIMQLVSGMIGLGRLTKFVPLPVIAGFTAGIGMIIIIGQLPRAFGLPPPAQSHIFDVFTHLAQYVHDFDLRSVLLVILTLLITRGLPKFYPKFPAILVAVVVVTFVANFSFFQGIALIGDIPHSLPLPRWPSMPQMSMGELFFGAFTIYILASLETLLSSTAIDNVTKGAKHDSNQELIGQGLGNIAVSLFGGIPSTGVIARSALNVQAGAKTRRSSIIQSLVILLAVFFAAPLLSKIPIAALAGILFSVAFTMLDYREFSNLWRISRSEGLIYVTTFLTIVFFDLIAGVQAGIVAAAMIALWQAAKTHLHISIASQDNIMRLSLTGSLTFLSASKIDEIDQYLQASPDGQTIILDLSAITNMDSSGAGAIVEKFNQCINRSIKFYIKGPSLRFEPLFRMYTGDKVFNQHFIVSESELKNEKQGNVIKSFRGRLMHGIQKFYAERQNNQKRLFDQIKTCQDPHTLFITCCDSRIDPSLITSTDPGELFVIRNVGNFIPSYQVDTVSSEAAALNFALTYLEIRDIVICGHTNCGAMMACCNQNNNFPFQLQTWIEILKKQLENDKKISADEMTKINVINQIQNLKSYPIVKEKILRGVLNIHAWYYDFEKNCIYEWNNELNSFSPIVNNSLNELSPETQIYNA